MVVIPRRGEAKLGRRPNTPHQPNRQRIEELPLTIGIDHNQPVRLGHLRRDLGQVFGAGGTHRDRKAHLVAHPGPNRRRDLSGWSEQPPRATDVQERLVDRDPLHHGRVLTEDRHDPIAQSLVLLEVSRDEHQVGAGLAGPPPGHPTRHAEALRLVRCGQHHPAAHRHRPATQPRVKQLLDRCVERVEVGMQDRRAFNCHRVIVANMCSLDTYVAGCAPWTSIRFRCRKRHEMARSASGGEKGCDRHE